MNARRRIRWISVPREYAHVIQCVPLVRARVRDMPRDLQVRVLKRSDSRARGTRWEIGSATTNYRNPAVFFPQCTLLRELNRRRVYHYYSSPRLPRLSVIFLRRSDATRCFNARQVCGKKNSIIPICASKAVPPNRTDIQYIYTIYTYSTSLHWKNL